MSAQTPPFDLVVRRARLSGHNPLHDIAIAGERIAAIAPAVEGDAAKEIDAEGRLASPAFVQPHIHLDKGARRSAPSAEPHKAPPFLQQLDVLFANKFFDAYDAASGGSVPGCWVPLFDARHDPRIAPLQFALAGMNAHISHDLAIGVVETCHALDVAPTDDCPQHVDYQSVNAILGATEAQTKQWLLTGAIKELDHAVAPVDDAVAIWSIERARDAAWVRAEVLWHLRDHKLLTDAYRPSRARRHCWDGRPGPSTPAHHLTSASSPRPVAQRRARFLRRPRLGRRSWGVRRSSQDRAVSIEIDDSTQSMPWSQTLDHRRKDPERQLLDAIATRRQLLHTGELDEHLVVSRLTDRQPPREAC